MERDEFRAGDVAPASGAYVQLNVVGTPTGTAIVLDAGGTFPPTPKGFTWKPLGRSQLPSCATGRRIIERVAGTALTAQMREEPLKLAQRLDAVANRREERERISQAAEAR